MAAGRKAVSDLQALGQPELLQLPDVALERLRLLTEDRREVPCAHGRAVSDQPQDPHRPGAVPAGSVQTRQSQLDVPQLVIGDTAALPQRDARVAPRDAEVEGV